MLWRWIPIPGDLCQGKLRSFLSLFLPGARRNNICLEKLVMWMQEVFEKSVIEQEKEPLLSSSKLDSCFCFEVIPGDLCGPS